MQATAFEDLTRTSTSDAEPPNTPAIQVPQLQQQALFKPGNIVQCMSAKCPCGNWVFIGIAGHLRRASDVRSWSNLKCPTCLDGFSANYETLDLVSVPFLIFELGYCTPETLYQS